MNYNNNPRDQRAAIAQETLDIIAKGSYINTAGQTVQVADQVRLAVAGSRLYSPSQLTTLNQNTRTRISEHPQHKARIEVSGETTLQAAQRLVVQEGIEHTVCLNFASAKNPGGGFLGGSQAQEESLARASALYPCISPKSEMYNYNRNLKTGLYSHYMIHSPLVPVFRDRQDALLPVPYAVSIITAPAVNAGVVREREASGVSRIAEVMLERIRYILAVAAEEGHKAIVLGAFGCGVFRNEPLEVAGYFRQVLLEEGYSALFDKIVFAVLDQSSHQSTISAFRRKLL